MFRALMNAHSHTHTHTEWSWIPVLAQGQKAESDGIALTTLSDPFWYSWPSLGGMANIFRLKILLGSGTSLD